MDLARHIAKIQSEVMSHYSVIIAVSFVKFVFPFHMFSFMKASVEHNAWELKQYIEEFYWESGKRVMLLGKARKVRSLYSNEV